MTDPGGAPSGPAAAPPAAAPRSWLQDTAAHLVSTQLALIVGLALTLYTRGVLSVEAFGAYGLLRLLASYLGYARIGLEEAAERELPLSRGAGDAAAEERILSTLFGAVLVECALGALLGLAAMPWLVAAGVPRAAALLLPPLLLLQPLAGFYWVAYRGGSHFWPFGRILIVLSLTELALTVPLVWWLDLQGLLLAQVVNLAIKVAVMHAVARRGALFRFRLALDRAELDRLARIGLPLLGGGLVAQVYVSVDSALVARELGLQALGLYTLGTLFGTRAGELLNGLAVTFRPRLLGAVGRTGSLAAALDDTRLHVDRALGVGYPGIVALVVVGLSWVVRHVLPSYEPALPVIRLVVASAAFCAAQSFPGVALISTGRLFAPGVVAGACALAGAGAMGLALRAGLGLEAVAVVMGLMHYVAFLALSALVRRDAGAASPFPGPGALAPLAAVAVCAAEAWAPAVASPLLDAALALGKLAAFAALWSVVLAAWLGRPRFLRVIGRGA